jgi:hypothetical protein
VSLFATQEGGALYRATWFTTGDMVGMPRLIEPRR